MPIRNEKRCSREVAEVSSRYPAVLGGHRKEMAREDGSRPVWAVCICTPVCRLCGRYLAILGRPIRITVPLSPSPNGPGRLADKVVQPTTQSAEGCTYSTTRLPSGPVTSPVRAELDWAGERLGRPAIPDPVHGRTATSQS